MSLDVYLHAVRLTTIYQANVTHNLAARADAAGIYEAMWRPDENGIAKAEQLIAPLRAGLTKLKADPERFRSFNPPNGWGDYDNFVRVVEEYLTTCEANPDAEIGVSR